MSLAYRLKQISKKAKKAYPIKKEKYIEETFQYILYLCEESAKKRFTNICVRVQHPIYDNPIFMGSNKWTELILKRLEDEGFLLITVYPKRREYIICWKDAKCTDHE